LVDSGKEQLMVRVEAKDEEKSWHPLVCVVKLRANEESGRKLLYSLSIMAWKVTGEEWT
jgi:hypothetical protein